MALKVTKISRIEPAINSSHDSTDTHVFRLTFFDLRWIKFHPTERIIFYKLTTTNSSHDSFYTLILPKLELSLSLVLRHYLPLAGRLTWSPQDPKPSIVVSPNDSVSLTVAESNVDFSFISGKGPRPETEIRSLVPKSPTCDSPSVLSLQVTLFPNQGFSIGVAAHHSVMDGKSMVMFIKSWAYICKHEAMALPEELTPVLDRSVINISPSLDAKILELSSYLSEEKDGLRSLKRPPLGEISSEIVRVTLELSRDDIDRLKERTIRESSRSYLDLHLSTFVVANAFLWTCLVKTRGGDGDRPVRFMYAADFRNRLNEPVRGTYVGNCVFPVGCFGYKAKFFMGEDGFVKMVEILSDSVRGIDSLGIEALCLLYIDGTKSVKPGTQTGSIAGSNRFGLYGSDFGWGKPCNSEIVSIDRNEAFSMSERKDGFGGVEIGLCLKKCEMDIFVSLFKNDLEN